MSILLFVVVLAILILSHEFGHFIVAKKSGIRVDEFGFGFPPKLFGYKKGETVYSFNILPFGGFVKIFGENPDGESLAGPDHSRSLTSKPKLTQAAVLVAGVACNLLLAWIFLSVGFMVGMPVSTQGGVATTQTQVPQLLITGISPKSPALEAGLKPGDEIISLAAGQNDDLSELSPGAVSEFVSSHSYQNISIDVRRNGQIQNFVVKPVSGLVENRAVIGITMDQVTIAKLSFFNALGRGAALTYNITLATVVGLWQLITQALTGQSVLDNITGPIGLVGLVSEAAGLGFVYLLSFTAFISINLAVLNLVPFPALDGGRLLFLLIEKIKGSAIRPQTANTLNLIGFGLLLLLMLVVTYGDVHRLLF